MRFSARIGLIAGVVVLITPAWTEAAQGLRPTSEFEVRNQEGVKKNPTGLNFELRTQNGRAIYHFYETIPVEMVFSSSQATTYSIELEERRNHVGQDYKFEVQPIDKALLAKPNLLTRGFECCDSHRPYLSASPIVLRKELTDFLRFEEPGTYRIFVTTRRVLRGKGNSNSKNEMDRYIKVSDFTLTSNLLTLTILPDDPEWDNRQLSDMLRRLHDPQIINICKKTRAAELREIEVPLGDRVAPHDAEQTAYVRALKALNALDTKEAIIERVAFATENS